MYTCKKCGQEFMDFGDYQEHLLEEAQRQTNDLVQTIKGMMAELSSVFRQQTAHSIASACITSGKSAEEGIALYHEVLSKLAIKE